MERYNCCFVTESALEDAVAPLRDAVAYVRDEPSMMDSKEVSIYEKVCSLLK